MCTPSVLGLEPRDRALAIVPQFHASGWGLPYAAFLSGASLLMPGRYLQAEPLARFIAAERPTVSAAVPTVWADLYRYGNDHELDVSSLRLVVCGGSALPQSLMERFQERDGLRLIQGWGMTEMSPVSSRSPADATLGERRGDGLGAPRRAGSSGVELRIVGDDGEQLLGRQRRREIEVRRPGSPPRTGRTRRPRKFHDGWLRTGDVGTVTPNGYMQITDQAKDVIKSGGEWIGSVELENPSWPTPTSSRPPSSSPTRGGTSGRWRASSPPARPTRPGSSSSSPATWPSGRCPNWAFVDVIPKTSVGKFDKKALRTQYEKGDLAPARV